MPIVYQHELTKNLLSLNAGLDQESVHRLVRKMNHHIKLNKKYFSEDYLIIFNQLTHAPENFEDLFTLLLNSSSVKEQPFRMFLPAALYDIITDHQYDFIGHTQQRLLEMFRENKNHPEPDGFYSELRNYDEDWIEAQYHITQSQAHHTLTTGNQLVEFLKSYIELEHMEMSCRASESPVKRDLCLFKPSSEGDSKRRRKKSVRFVEDGPTAPCYGSHA